MEGKELIKFACHELEITQKELAEKIGANIGTVMNWSSKGEVPIWAKNFIKVLIENHKNNKILSLIRETNRLLNI